MIESYVTECLTAQMPDFSMEEFAAMLTAREGHLDGDVFDLLYSLGDFAVFKDFILGYKPENQVEMFGPVVTNLGESPAFLMGGGGGGAAAAAPAASGGGADDMVVSPARPGGSLA
eukprot:COSAG05_NODE_269_length_12494_cov_9.329326_1_plen_116_part_00